MANIGAITLLKCNPLFRQLGDETLSRIVGLGRNREYAAQEVIFKQGDRGDALYGVISGVIAITTVSERGQILRLNTHLPGEVTGEIALLDGGVRTASATMVEPGVLFVLERERFLKLLNSERGLAIRFLELACQRIRWTSRLLEESAFMNVAERLSSRLIWLSRTSGVESPATDDEPAGVRVRISQTELAQWLNVSRQAVNGYLQAWQAKGYLKLSRGSVLIRDLDGLDLIR